MDRLETLRLSGADNVRGAGLEALARLLRLRELGLIGGVPAG